MSPGPIAFRFSQPKRQRADPPRVGRWNSGRSPRWTALVDGGSARSRPSPKGASSYLVTACAFFDPSRKRPSLEGLGRLGKLFFADGDVNLR